MQRKQYRQGTDPGYLCVKWVFLPFILLSIFIAIVLIISSGSQTRDQELNRTISTVSMSLEEFQENTTAQIGRLDEVDAELVQKDMQLMEVDAALAMNISQLQMISNISGSDIMEILDSQATLQANITLLQMKDMELMNDVAALNMSISDNSNSISTIEMNIMTLEQKDVQLMGNITSINVDIQMIETVNMMQQAQIDALAAVGNILNQTNVNITEKLGTLMMDAMALEGQLEITFNKSMDNMMAISTLQSETFSSLVLQSPASGMYTGSGTMNQLRLTPGNGISMSIDGTPSVVVSNTGVLGLSGDNAPATFTNGDLYVAGGMGISTTLSGSTLTIDATSMSSGITNVFGDSGTCPVNSSTLNIAGGTYVDTVCSGGDTITVDVDVPALVPTLAPSFAPSSVVSGVTGISASSGGTAVGPDVTIVGGGIIETSRSGNIITINATAAGSGGILEATADSGTCPTTDSTLTIAGGTYTDSTCSGTGTISVDVDLPALVPALAPSFAPSSVVSGVTGISASSGGTAVGPDVTIVGSNGISTSRSGNTVTVEAQALSGSVQCHWCAVRRNNVGSDYNYIANTVFRWRTIGSITFAEVDFTETTIVVPSPPFQSAAFTPNLSDPPLATDNFIRLCAGTQTLANYGASAICVGQFGGACTCINPPVGGTVCSPPAYPLASESGFEEGGYWSTYASLSMASPINGLIQTGMPTNNVDFLILYRNFLDINGINTPFAIQSKQFWYESV